jgi:hypothetical protein
VTEETNAGKKEEPNKVDPAPSSKAQPVDPPAPPIVGIGTKEQVTGESESKKPKEKCDKSKEILVRVLEPDALSQFERKTLFWGRWGIGLAVATFVIGILTLIVFYRQLGLMQTQLQDADSDSRTSSRHARQQIKALQSQVSAIQTQMRQDQRPYIEITLGGPGPNKPFEIKMPNNVLHLPLILTVWGKTPAKHVHGRLFLEVVKFNQDPLLDKNTVPALDTFSGIVFPNVPDEFHAVRMKAKKGNPLGEFDLLKDWETSDISASRSYLAAYGTYTYDDSFGIQHWTKFCVSFQASGPITQPTPGCVRYNEVDNNQ